MKKLLGIIVLGLLLSGNAYAGTCKTPKNPKEKFVLAPEPVSYTRKSPTNRIEEVLSNRKTINVFRAWNDKINSEKYGLRWTGGRLEFKTSKSFVVRELYWNYAYPNKSWYIKRYPKINKFLTNRNWGHDKEYGRTLSTNLENPDFLSYLQNKIQEKEFRETDGILLDWWHNRHQGSGGYSKKTVKKFRTELAKQTREKFGKDFLIIGNVNWDKDTGTHNYINGVFMELYKKKKKKSEMLK